VHSWDSGAAKWLLQYRFRSGSETKPDDIPKWDSFRFVEIILQVEEKLGAKIRAREASKLRNIGEMVQLICSKQAV
jgi:acyl carrier protein